MSLKKKLFILISACILILSLIILFYIRGQVINIVEVNENRQYNAIINTVEKRMAKQLEKAELTVLSIANNPEVQRIFAAGQREELYQFLAPTYDSIKDSFDQFQFHLPDSTSFLRMHLPSQFDDDLSGFRDTVNEANRTQQLTTGLEGGVGGYGFRAVAPVFYEEQHIGSVELGAEFGTGFIQELKDDFGGEYIVYTFRENNIDSKLENFEVEDNRLVATVEEDSWRVDTEVIQRVKQGEKEIKRSANGSEATLLFPIKDFNNEVIGYLKIIQDRKEVLSLLSQTGGNVFILTLAVLLVTAVIVFKLIEYVFEPLDRFKEVLTQASLGNLKNYYPIEQVDCVELMNCDNSDCPEYEEGKTLCWFEVGSYAPKFGREIVCPRIINGEYQSCQKCKVYQRVCKDEVLTLGAWLNKFIEVANDMVVEIEKHQQRLGNVFEKVGIVFWSQDLSVDELSYVSDSCQQLFGYSAAEFYEQPELWQEIIHPEDVDFVLAEQTSLYESKEGVETEHRVIKAQGEVVWIKNFVIPILDDEEQIVRLDGIAYDITELKLTEQELAKSRQLYSNIVNSQQEMICRFDPDTTLTFANQAYLDYFGVTEEELIGNKFLDLIPSEDHEHVLAQLEELAATGEPITYQHQAEVKGEIRWQQWTDYPIYDEEGEFLEFQSIGIDITERKRAEERAKKIKKRYQSLVEAQQDLIVRLDLEGRCTYVNDIFCETVGKSRKELLGRSFANYIYQADLSKFKEEFKQLTDKPFKSEFEIRLETIEGLNWFNWKVYAIVDQEGEVEEIQGVARDITELKEALSQAEAANKAKSQFLANMSHEIRTPLNAVIGFSEILESQVEDGQQRAHLQAIKAAGRSLLNLINDILDISKIEAGILEVDLVVMDLKSLLDDMERIFLQEAEEKGLSLMIDYESSLPLIEFDEGRLRQILLNLIGNAIKFTQQGHVKITVKTEAESKAEQLKLIIEVEDSGIGINEEDQERVFAPFTQQKGQKIEDYEGTGLGLTITRRLTELLGGKITLDSELGAGTVFRLEFPEVNIVEATTEDEEENFKENIYFTGAEVLVVDDVNSNRKLLKTKLENKGLTVIEAASGTTGVAKAVEFEPELILMDIKMPQVNGYQAKQRIRDKGLEMPIIALTAYATKAERERAKAVGFDGFIAKPIEDDKLNRELAKYLDFAVQEELDEQSENLEEIVNLTELQRSLNNDFKEEFEELQKAFVINEVEDFAQQLYKLAKQHQATELAKYAQALETYANNFELQKLKEKFESFPAKVESLLNS
ncbi:PAS domain S-box protein [Fuchsiella alkaliacetigena]|uniref:PAS domain S-box protein n=1 Tax=Fuchsiella alkaliacetigena TaxID=957042 RepID=UPI00200B5B7D|nr:PAS domain S-box protein [Fuchsiella alkaliacetigena]MCK8823720.1 PAS domain S-box protein [Fuchsiella alkaliacetigena]